MDLVINLKFEFPVIQIKTTYVVYSQVFWAIVFFFVYHIVVNYLIYCYYDLIGQYSLNFPKNHLFHSLNHCIVQIDLFLDNLFLYLSLEAHRQFRKIPV